jgi:hypothetical protein
VWNDAGTEVLTRPDLAWPVDSGVVSRSLRDVQLDASVADAYGWSSPNDVLYATADDLASTISTTVSPPWRLSELALQAAHWSHFQEQPWPSGQFEDWLTDADGGLLLATATWTLQPGGLVRHEAVLPFEVGWVQCGLGPEAQVVLDGTRFTLGRSTLDAGGYQWRIDLHEAVVSDFQGNGLIELSISRDGLLIPSTN